MNKIYVIIFLSVLLLFPVSHRLFGQTEPDSLFEYNHPFQVTIAYSYDAFGKTLKESDYTPATISYKLPDSTLVEKKIRIRPRGNSRRDQCQHPPLKIDFSDTLYGVSLFDNWGKMKLVSMCLQAANFDQYIIKEYLIYQALEKLTEASFRTYLVRVTFEDTDSKKTYTSPGFFIEDIDDLVKRLNADEIKTNGLQQTALDTASFDLMALFQYMIGNTDWYVPNLHNLKLIKINDASKTKPVAVPYDFDYCGLVNAVYAIPHEGLPIETVRDRYFMGLCRNEKYYMPVVNKFIDKKAEIYSLFANCDSLSNFTKKDVINYLDNFYKIIENTNIIGKYIYGNCD